MAHHSEPAREAVAQWRYSINYGPDGEANYANVHAADGQFVGNLRTHHAIAICNAFAVCERLASSPAATVGEIEVGRNGAQSVPLRVTEDTDWSHLVSLVKSRVKER